MHVRLSLHLMRSLPSVIQRRAIWSWRSWCPRQQSLPNVGSRTRLCAIPVRSVAGGNGHVWEQTRLPLHVRGGLISLCNTGPVATGKHIVCIHDVNTRTHGESYSTAFRALYRCLHPLLGRRATAIATVSRYSAGELARLGIANSDKIFVAGNGHEHTSAWIPCHSQATREAAGPRTIVVVGSRARHKNIDRVLDLAPQLGSAGLRIAVIGASDPRVFSGPTEEQASPHVRWLGRLADEELAALFRDSLCLAFPSLDEGFGLPPLEAMAMGCPVVVSTSASLPEVCGKAALYASPLDSEAWLAALLRLSNDTALRSSLAAAGRERARTLLLAPVS